LSEASFVEESLKSAKNAILIVSLDVWQSQFAGFYVINPESHVYMRLYVWLMEP